MNDSFWTRYLLPSIGHIKAVSYGLSCVKIFFIVHYQGLVDITQACVVYIIWAFGKCLSDALESYKNICTCIGGIEYKSQWNIIWDTFITKYLNRTYCLKLKPISH